MPYALSWTRRILAVACFAVLTQLGTQAVATESRVDAAKPGSDESRTWPQWRGPMRNGLAPATPQWPAKLAPESLTKLWRVDDLGPSYSGPIVTEDRVFSTETKDKKLEIVRAFDRKTGKELWSTEWEGAMKVPFFAAKNGSWIRSTPAFDGDHLYVGGIRDVIVCLDAATGKTVWSYDCPGEMKTPVPAFGFVCSPLVQGDHVNVQAGGSLLKLDKKTGEKVWLSLADGGGMNSAFSSPVIETIHGEEQLLALTRTELCGVRPESGDVLWRRPVKSFRGMNILTPVLYGDAVFTAPYGGEAQLLTISRDEQNAFSITPAWQEKVQGYMTSPVLIDGHAYFFTRNNRFVCLSLDEGATKWTSGPTGDKYWSLVAQGDRILALNDTGKLRLIQATPEDYRVIAEVQVADDKTWAHLAVAGNEIFIREETGLAAMRWDG